MSMKRYGLTRRDLLRGAGFLTAAGAFAAVAGPLATTEADAAEPASQSNWRYCVACATLKYGNGTDFYGGDACMYNAGHGYNGGAHSWGTRNYYLYTSLSGATGQTGWRYCNYCSEIFWPEAAGMCPFWLSRPHQPSSWVYTMLTTGANPPAGQSGWRYCAQCKALVWPGGFGGDQCTSGTFRHRITGWDYTVPYS